MRIIITLLVLLTSSLNAQTMIPLSKYLDENSFEKNEMFYVFTRCSAVGYKLMDLNKDRPELNETGKTIYQTYFYFGTEIRKTIMPDDDDDQQMEITGMTVGSMVDAYTEVSNDHYIKTGLYFSDWMLEDLKVCSDLLGQL